MSSIFTPEKIAVIQRFTGTKYRNIEVQEHKKGDDTSDEDERLVVLDNV